MSLRRLWVFPKGNHSLLPWHCLGSLISGGYSPLAPGVPMCYLSDRYYFLSIGGDRLSSWPGVVAVAISPRSTTIWASSAMSLIGLSLGRGVSLGSISGMAGDLSSGVSCSGGAE